MCHATISTIAECHPLSPLQDVIVGANKSALTHSDQTRKTCVTNLHDATSAFDHEDNLDGQSDKQGNNRTDTAAIYGRSSDQKEYPVDWTPHEDIPRQATEAGSLLSTVFWSQKERALVSRSRIPQ